MFIISQKLQRSDIMVSTRRSRPDTRYKPVPEALEGMAQILLFVIFKYNRNKKFVIFESDLILDAGCRMRESEMWAVKNTEHRMKNFEVRVKSEMSETTETTET